MALSRSEVLDGAMRLLQAEGLDALTMRSLADSLGVQAGAIYWHFKNKQDLYDAMVDAMFEGSLDPPVTGSWDRRLGELSRRLAALVARHRDGARLATLSLRPGPATLALTEEMLAAARASGLSAKESLWAAAALGYYVLGYVTDMQATEAARAHGLDSLLNKFKKDLDSGRYPMLSQTSKGGLERMMTARSFAERFEFGLRVLLDGLEALRRTRKRKKPKVTAQPRKR
jgi:TetR/AcrR family transcriptional regulator, tetracycline repressor protein